MGKSRKLTKAEIKKLDASHSVAGCKAVVADLWAKACSFEGVEASASFVVFSAENPFAEGYHFAVSNLFAVSNSNSIRLV